MLLTRAHRRCWYHLIFVLHSTPSTTPFSLVTYKPASAYLDSPLHGSTPILKGAVNISVLAVPGLQLPCGPRAIRRDLSLVPCFSPINFTNCTYCQFIWPPAVAVRDDTQLYVAISKNNYDTPAAKLELCLSTLHAWFCYNGLALNPDKSCWALPSAHVLFQLPPLSILVEPLSRFPIRSGFSAILLTADSHLLHTSQHFQNTVSIISVHSATSVPISHSSACSLVGCLLDYASSTSWWSRLRTFLGFNVCKARSLVLSHVSETHQHLQDIAGASLASYQVMHNCQVATLTYKLMEYGEPAYLRSHITMCAKILIRWQATQIMFIP